MKYYKLDYYVDKLKKGEKFSLARYGDGEFLCMWGKKGGNSNGCAYTPELREALLESMKITDPNFIFGMQRVLPADEKKAIEMWPVDWHDSEFLSEAVAEGKLFPLIEQLRKMKVAVISNTDVINTTSKIIYNFAGSRVPKSNAYEGREHLVNFITHKYDPEIQPEVFLFSCGMAANALIGECHGKTDAWLIDVGHIWDPFSGLMSRCDLEGKTQEDINRNLCP